jgi:hypothetical protein
VEGAESLPGVLKGADMAVYTVFKALGLDVEVCNVLDGAEEVWFDVETGSGSGSGSGSELEVDEICEIHYRLGRLGQLTITDEGGYEGANWNDILDDFSRRRQRISWLTGPPEKYRNPGFVHLAVST